MISRARRATCSAIDPVIREVGGTGSFVVLYCRECDWDIAARSHTQRGLDALVVEHELLTDHEITSVWIDRDGGQDRDRRLRVSTAFWPRLPESSTGDAPASGR